MVSLPNKHKVNTNRAQKTNIALGIQKEVNHIARYEGKMTVNSMPLFALVQIEVHLEDFY